MEVWEKKKIDFRSMLNILWIKIMVRLNVRGEGRASIKDD